ncbi:MAG: carboxypeptidase regulatory-like domain-containing protein, partial [bacterium]|nr:carboxypeptidase regulatory-like domain-containing protein [bacterium]
MKSISILALAIIATTATFAQTTLTGNVASRKDEPITGAIVAILADNGSEVGVVKTDSTGDFKITGLNPGIYTVRVDAQDWMPSEKRGIIVGEDREASVDFALI